MDPPTRVSIEPKEPSALTEAYPSPPWRLGGRQWAGLFGTEQPVNAESAKSIGAKPVFRNRIGIALLSYDQGDLHYDELFIGIPIWLDRLPRLWIRDIWVSDERSRQAGIHEWNLPKRLATFDWTEHQVTIRDERGLVASLETPDVFHLIPFGCAVLPIAGNRDGGWKTAFATWTGRVSLTKPTVKAWSDRFNERIVQRGIGFSSSKMRMVVRGSKHTATTRD